MGDNNIGGDGGEVDGDGGGGNDVDGDGSGGTSPSRQGARTETSVPQNFSSMAAALRNCFGKNADCLRVFRPEAIYRWRGGVRGLIHLKRIYNFLCSMLVFTPFALCFVKLRGVFMRFPELTY
jgi:hypothetical protein